MARGREDQITIEDARVVWANFSGAEKKYNRKGDRNFCILLEDDLAKEMIEKGWNVKFLRPREEGDEPKPYIEVRVKFGDYPPRIVFLTMRGRNAIDEDLVDAVDKLEVEQWDLTIRPYDWEVNGNTGRTAYLKTMYIKILEDPLDVKYANWELENGDEIVVDALEDGQMLELEG